MKVKFERESRFTVDQLNELIEKIKELIEQPLENHFYYDIAFTGKFGLYNIRVNTTWRLLTITKI